ncbi:MAG: HlyD family secretion protein [Chloroflexia bacterium]
MEKMRALWRSHRKQIIIGMYATLVLAAALLLAWRWWARNHRNSLPNVLRASGVIEVEEIEIAAEIGGRVVHLEVDEGDSVTEGQILIQLDDSLARAQLDQALASAEAARAAYAKALAGPTKEELAQATATLSQTLAARDGALLVWQAAQALVENPQQVLTQYHAAKGLKEVAEAQATSTAQLGYTMKENARLLWYNSANTLRDAQAAYSLIYWHNRNAEKERELTQEEKDAEAAAWRRVEDAERLMKMGEMNYYLAETLEAQNNAIAQANVNTAKRLVSDLGWIVHEPLSIQAQAAQAEAQYRQAEAAVRVAQAALDRVRAGASPADLAILRAQLHQAEAAVQMARLQVERTTIRAPASGLVLTRSIHEGELAVAGVPLLTIGDLDTVRLTLYIPENRYGLVRLGQTVRIAVDSFPGETFTGEVVYISPQAEFTPKDVQTQAERVHLVYAVRVRVPNPGHRLKPGMPADAEILVGP